MSYFEQFVDFIRSEYSDSELVDIKLYGAAHAAPLGIIYYEDCNRFWNDNLELCEGAATEVAYDILDTTLPDLIKSLDTGNEEWHNIKQNLLLLMFELAAEEIISEED